MLQTDYKINPSSINSIAGGIIQIVKVLELNMREALIYLEGDDRKDLYSTSIKINKLINTLEFSIFNEETNTIAVKSYGVLELIIKCRDALLIQEEIMYVTKTLIAKTKEKKYEELKTIYL